MGKITLKELYSCFQRYDKGTISSEDLEHMMVSYMAQGENTIPNMLKILQVRESYNKELLLDTNLELSRALTGLINFSTQKESDKTMRTFMIGKIKEHYLKWQSFILCCFKIEGLP